MLNAFRHQRFFHNYLPKGQPPAIYVLNAFRHQRFFHARERGGLRAVRSAQRLSASKVLSPLPPLPILLGDLSAQRLSASKVLSLGHHSHEFCQQVVLNAFRHQRFFHQRNRTPHPQTPPVLNAFRHQRFFHWHRWHRRLRHRRVLNAFRHQRFFHKYYCITANKPGMCSTPFGIKGSFTPDPFDIRPEPSRVLNAFRHQRFFHS